MSKNNANTNVFEILDPLVQQHRALNKEFYIAVDGRSGSGKSTLAEVIALKYHAPIFHIDDIFPGWDGFAEGIELYIETVLKPLRQHKTALWQGWDWHNNQPKAAQTISTAPIMVFEGTGTSDHRTLKYLDFTLWIDCPTQLRKKRALQRDGNTYKPHWDQWASQEEAWLTKNQPKDYVDLVVRVENGGK